MNRFVCTYCGAESFSAARHPVNEEHCDECGNDSCEFVPDLLPALQRFLEENPA